jgi:hypothetical protein
MLNPVEEMILTWPREWVLVVLVPAAYLVLSLGLEWWRSVR